MRQGVAVAQRQEGGNEPLNGLLRRGRRLALEAARRHDAAQRRKDHNPDRLLSLYNLGFEMDECVEERLQNLKRSGALPTDALPGLKDVLGEDVLGEAWDREGFAEWVAGHGPSQHTVAPGGRRLKGEPPAAPEQAVQRLVAALLPLRDDYSLPHFRRSA